MKALVYVSPGKTELREVPEPGLIFPHDVKVRIYGTGVCGSDLKIVQGNYAIGQAGTILGHEGVGTVAEVGPSVTGLKAGDRVVINPTQSCGLCSACRVGHYCYCEKFEDHQVGYSLPGTFADYYVGHERYLYRIPDSMSWRTASLIEPLGCALNGLVKAQVQAGDSVLVIGSGPMGLLSQSISMKLARLTVATEISPFRRDFARTVSDHALHPDELTPAFLREINGGRRFDVVIDAVGNQIETALSFVAKGGRVVPLGCDDSYTAAVKPVDLIDNGISIVGAVPLHDAIGPAMEFAHRLPELERMVTTEVPLEHFMEAFDATMGIDRGTGESRQLAAIKALILS
ncbi:zinc-binding dehydrogenase [Streptomyces sp. NPDC060035]|uniref:zinc-dependent alcohol dehydrogenase n=1 Tax=Streptomyces sp. NPDC060035 TaxID=3347044 RepID=UPI0036B91E4D